MALEMKSSDNVRPPVLDSISESPRLFDGTTRLYVSYVCPYSQRVWIARNYKGLQEKIELVALDLKNKPAWYKEKVYPANKVPAFEYNNEVKGESMDLVRYIDGQFEGPALLPNVSKKQGFADEFVSYCDTFNKVNFAAFTSEGDAESEVAAVYDKLEGALSRFDEGPFFLGQFSLVDIAYAPFIERFHLFLLKMRNYDITKDRPLLSQWIEELNKLTAYAQTRLEPQELLEFLKEKYAKN